MFVKGAAIYKTLGYHGFYIGATDLEQALDMVSHMITREATLVEVNVSDKGEEWMALPIEAFDGTLFTQALRELQDQWNEALNGNTHS